MFSNIESVIEKYENGEYNNQIYSQFDDIVIIPTEDYKKFNIKPFYDWFEKPIDKKIQIDSELILFVKENKLPTLFFMDVKNLLIRGYSWEQAIIYYHNNRKPLHPKLRQILLTKERGYIRKL